MSAKRAALAAVLAVAVSPAVVRAAPPPAKPSGCRMEMSGEFKVRIEQGRLVTPIKVNGLETLAILDTGAFVSMISVPGAAALGLRRQNLDNVTVVGAGGATQAYRTNVKRFELGGVELKDRDFMVAGERGFGPPLLIGRDFLGRTDIEFDLKHGVVRLLEPKGCSPEAMAYWARGAYSQASLRAGQRADPLNLDLKLNGKPVRAMLDSGASVSVATRAAALRAGLKLVATDEKGRGVGPRDVDHYVAEIDSFDVGDETIGRTRLRVSDLFRGAGFVSTGSRIASDYDGGPEMLLGLDFLGSHRVLVSPSQRAIYFTYEGGPVFDTTRAPTPAATPAADAKPGG